MKSSSPFGNLNPASLKALPKSFSFGKSIWQVLQLVPYILENAGIAKLLVALKATTTSTTRSKNFSTGHDRCRCMTVLPGSIC